MHANCRGCPRCGLWNRYGLPRITCGPYMSEQEIDIQYLPPRDPSQWVLSDPDNIRPWQPRYPVMTVPPQPLPLFVAYR